MNNLREQVGQLFMIGFTGTSVSSELASFIKEYKPGGVIVFSRNLESPAQIIELTTALQACSPHSPLLISIDQEGGRVSRLPKGFTIFPACEVLGRCNSAELAYAVAATTAAELKAVGINMNMSPVLDVNSNPDNPVIGDRAFGSDPETVSELGGATIAGLQDNRIVACGKHFPGHGDTAVDSHKELPVVNATMERLREIELPAFRHAVRQGVAAMMTAHVLYPALDAYLPATLSEAIVTGLLRNEVGYDGLVLTDDLEMHAIVDHYGVDDAAVRAFAAGCDMLLICKDANREAAAIAAVEHAVTTGQIPRHRLERSLTRIAAVKRQYVIPYKPPSRSGAGLVVGCRTHQALLTSILHARDRLEKVSL